MSRIDPNFIRHKLNVLSDARLMKQQGRKLATEYVDAMIEEVENLKEVSAIIEVLYSSCLFNTVVVKKNTKASGGSVWISQVSTELTQKTISHCQRSTKWWTLSRVMPG